jgi:murein DD-endopeptidase MepM/ murein hydrolase activator NlpD
MALCAVVVLTQAAPATAESPSGLRQKRDAARARRVAIAAKIDAARASDQQLATAVANLDNAVRAQVATTESAQQALAAAEVNVRQSEARLNATQQRVNDLRSRAVDSAVDAYMHAGGHTVIDIVQAHDLNELSRRETFVKQLVANDRDILDQLRTAQQDQAAERSRLAKARDVTRARRKAQGEKLRDLASQLKVQARLRGAVDARIAEYAEEAEKIAAEEGSLQKLINAAQASTSTGPASAAGLIWPCRGPLTSGFGMRWGRLHQGQDIACGMGTAIHAAKAGTVIFAGQMSGYGNVIIIDHGGGFSTLYAHQSRLAASQGQRVNQGDVIGYVGSTGHSTGPHLHFETRFNGTARNPRPYLP